MRVGILGIGAIGGLLAALLHRNGYNPICISREKTSDLIISSGLKLDSKIFGNYNFYPRSTSFLDEDLDLLFIATKTQYLPMALKQVNPNALRNSIIIPLLNGVGFMSLLESTFGKNVIYGTIGALEAKIEKNIIFHKSLINCPVIQLGTSKKNLLKKVNSIIELLNQLDINTSYLEKERHVVWNKLIRLNTLSSFTAAYQLPIGNLRHNPDIREEMELFTKETIEVANLDGYNATLDEVMMQIDNLPPELCTSLQRDIADHKQSELDFITGGVLKLGKGKNISMPIHFKIYTQYLKK
jgi:2-dehydropantoate 2-reductase